LEWVRRIARQKIRLELGVKTPKADNATTELRIPTQTGHLLRLKPAIEYDPKRPPIMMNPATPERA
jgi:hypothetical protein